MMRHVTAAVVLYMVATSIGWAQNTETRLLGYTIDDLVDRYVELALFREAGAGTEGAGVLAKWSPDASVRIVPQPSATLIERYGADLFVDETKDVSDFLASSISHPKVITFDRPRLEEAARQARQDGTPLERAIIIYIATRPELVSRMSALRDAHAQMFPDQLIPTVSNALQPARVGWSLRRGKDDFSLSRVFVFIEYRDVTSLRASLYEEIMQSFGIPYDFPDGAPSIFNDDDVYAEPTKLDLLLWRVHADPRLKAGMKEDEIRPIAREVIGDMVRG